MLTQSPAGVGTGPQVDPFAAFGEVNLDCVGALVQHRRHHQIGQELVSQPVSVRVVRIVLAGGGGRLRGDAARHGRDRDG
jgi:hypothetical protein